MGKYLLSALLFIILAPARAQIITTVAGGNGAGTGSNQFYYSYGVCLDRTGNIYVSDQLNARVQMFAAGSTSATDGVTIAGGNGIGNALNQLSNPTGVFVDSSGNVYVADQANARVLKFPPGSNSSTNGMQVAGSYRLGNNASELNDPTGIYVDRHGNIYVADANNNRIQMYKADSTYGITVAGGNGQGDRATQLSYSTAVCVDSSGNVYVADYLNNRIQMFPAGSDSATPAVTVAGGNAMGSSSVQLNSPTGICLDRSGNLYVADYYNNRIQLFPPGSTSATHGVTVAGGNGEGYAANQLNNPTSVYVDSAANIYIADYLNNRIQEWSPSPAGIAAIPASAGTLLYPNPNNGSFILESTGNIGKEFVIHDMIGRTVAQGLITSEKQNIGTKEILPAVYSLEITGCADKAIRFVVEN